MAIRPPEAPEPMIAKSGIDPEYRSLIATPLIVVTVAGTRLAVDRPTDQARD